MSQPTLRFVQASDFHLERPVHGLAEVPEHLRALLLEAPYKAALQVFETALAEEADGLLLAGDIIDVGHAGPRAIVFLLEQFNRLAERGIPVYWAGGLIDPPTAWPPSMPLPKNVHTFSVGQVETYPLKREEKTVARIQGVSCREDGTVHARGFANDKTGIFTLGVSYGTDDAAGKEGDRIQFMALGGRHKYTTVDWDPGIAHYCGTPQGRSPEELGPRGCTLVHVDETGRAKTEFIATDSVRWIEEKIEITTNSTAEQLLERLEERLEKRLSQSQGTTLLIQWVIRGTGPLVNRLRPGGLADELLESLNRRFGYQPPIGWSVSLTCDSPLAVPEEWYDHETILGDFLRSVRAIEQDEEFLPTLQSFLPEGLESHPLSAVGNVSQDSFRTDLLQRAAKLGVDLLTLPEDSPPDP